MPLFGFPAPPKKNFKDLKRSHSLEKLGPEHSEGLGKRLGEGRKDNRVCYNKLVATRVSELRPSQDPMRDVWDILSVVPLEDEEAGMLIHELPSSSLGGDT